MHVKSSGDGLPGSDQKEDVLKVQLNSRRVQSLIRRELKARAYRFEGARDDRRRRDGRSKVRWNLGAALLGQLVGASSLREVEELTEEAPGRALFGISERVPDTTVYRCLKRTHPGGVREALVQQVRQFQRSKRLEPVGLPCGLLVVDGKNVATLDKADDAGYGQRHSGEHHEVWLVRALRAVLASSRARVCIDQRMTPASTNDMGAFPAFFEQLEQTWAGNELFEVYSMDAGFASKDNAALIHEGGKGYLFGLKDNQPDLLAEARRLLLPLHERLDFEKATPCRSSSTLRGHKRLN